MNTKKILYSMLKEIKEGNNVNYNDFGITQEEFGCVIEIALDEKYIKNAMVLRNGIGNKVYAASVNDARLTLAGENYLEENSLLAKGYKGLKEIREWLPL